MAKNHNRMCACLALGSLYSAPQTAGSARSASMANRNLISLLELSTLSSFSISGSMDWFQCRICYSGWWARSDLLP